MKYNRREFLGLIGLALAACGPRQLKGVTMRGIDTVDFSGTAVLYYDKQNIPQEERRYAVRLQRSDGTEAKLSQEEFSRFEKKYFPVSVTKFSYSGATLEKTITTEFRQGEIVSTTSRVYEHGRPVTINHNSGGIVTAYDFRNGGINTIITAHGKVIFEEYNATRDANPEQKIIRLDSGTDLHRVDHDRDGKPEMVLVVINLAGKREYCNLTNEDSRIEIPFVQKELEEICKKQWTQ